MTRSEMFAYERGWFDHIKIPSVSAATRWNFRQN